MKANLSACLFFLASFSLPADCYGNPPHNTQSTWYVSTSGNNATGDGSQSNPWRSIQYANDNAFVLDGDVVSIAAGSYTEKIVVTKSLKFYGPNAAVSPNPTTASRSAEAVITAISNGDYIFEVRTPGTNVEIKGFKFVNGAPLHDGHHHRSSPNANDIVILFEKNWVHHCVNIFCGTLTTWKNVSIIDNFFDRIDLVPFASAIKLNDANDPPPAAQRAANVVATITDNRIDSTTWAGVLLDNIYSSTVLRNVIRNVPETGIKLAGGIGNATVSQNLIQKANGFHTADVAGLKIYGSEFTGAVNISNNTVMGSYNGFAVHNGENISGKNIHVFDNSFDSTNSDYAIYHGGSGNLETSCNWLGTWGMAGAATRISGPVTYSPFLTNATDYNALTPGFQPLPGTCNSPVTSPAFTRTILSTGLNRPWEIIYGPDNMLWITQSNGRVCRVDPNSGVVTAVYTAPDYYGGLASQNVSFPCGIFPVAAGTYGMVLHPDFLNTPYLYYIYSYNAGSPSSPVSKYKVRRLTWNAATQTITDPVDIILGLPLDFTHDGMRLLIAVQDGTPYIYITVGDGTIDIDDCYSANNNDNLRAQDWSNLFGKILRFNIDGTIPADNPITGSPVFTRGHRNPLGLAYNPATNTLYSSENGKSTDDEINIVQKGRNYGWPKARGYHSDNNYPGEAAFVAGYTPSAVPGDVLQEAFYSWCPSTVTLPEDPQNVNVTCAVAPSDMIYYPGNGVPAFKNSLLVTTLKTNANFKAGVYVFKLAAGGMPLDATVQTPKLYFAVPDSSISLRYRDITTSPDGRTFFICTDSWAGTNNIILKFVYNSVPAVYTFNGNGNWSDAANWIENKMPPATLSEGDEIIIDPVTGGQCLLNIPYTVSTGAKLTVVAGKKLVVQ